MARELKVICPCCESELVISPVTGKVIRHKKPSREAKPKDLDEVMEKMSEKPGQQDAFFGEALRDEMRRGDALDDAFRKAQERAASKDENEKPPSIYDFD